MNKKVVHSKLVRDISWLSFNARVLQEANDGSVPLRARLRFLGIFSNNLDEFFRVRVATLNRMMKFGKATKRFLEDKPSDILLNIQSVVLNQQKEFERIYNEIQVELKKEKIAIINEKKLSKIQQEFVDNYFNEKVRTNIAPLMIESIGELPLLQDKSIYLACMLTSSLNSFMNSYSLIEVPTQTLPRFVILPSHKGEKNIILLEDIIRHCLPKLFTQFGFDTFEGYIIKVTRDAELDIDNDVNTDLIMSIEKGLKNRKKGKAVRLVYDKSIQKNLLDYLVKLLSLNKSFVHPLLTQPLRILDVLNKRDVMLHFPYHSFDSIIDLLREAAIDPFVESIKITCYRLAKESKIIKALINAVRNGKKVTVVLELRARFDEEANLKWKRVLEEEGVDVKVGLPGMKVHAKLCLISKRVAKSLKHYGFVSTGNLNESTAMFYGDHCLLTSDKRIVSDIARIFNFIDRPTDLKILGACKTLIVSPFNTRSFFLDKFKTEMKHAAAKKKAGCILKLNSLADEALIDQLYTAANAGVDCKIIIRGICCALTSNKKWPHPIKAISIVDEYLEHARILYFNNNGKDDVYISSADWMLRNIDYRVEATTPIFNPEIKAELKHILDIQLSENEKARILDNHQVNHYVERSNEQASIRSQVEIYNYLNAKKY